MGSVFCTLARAKATSYSAELAEWCTLPTLQSQHACGQSTSAAGRERKQLDPPVREGPGEVGLYQTDPLRLGVGGGLHHLVEGL